ncbi:MAG: sulfotransferase [Hyphomicrobiaceae bacterium]|nr:sulfotransferase [Hyphomicrobiaceae bacterium]
MIGAGRYREAAELATRLLKVNPGHPEILACRAMSVWSMGGDVKLALRDMKQAITAAPQSASLRHNLATILASTGATDEARAAFGDALRLNPNDAQAFFSLAQNQRYKETDATVRHFEAMLETGGLPDQLREYAQFGLSKVYDDLGDAARSMSHAHEANRLNARPYDMVTERRRLENLEKLIASGSLKVPATEGRLRPVFVLGMPRSGTTLVESVLARNPAVYAGGEYSPVFLAEQQLLKLEQRSVAEADLMLPGIDRDVFARQAEDIRKFYRQRMRPEQTYFTDKLPHNAERIGLIAMLFPEARIIHVRRHPLAVGLSNYFTRFFAGNGYSNDLALIGEHLVNVWKSVDLWSRVPGIEIFDLRYEDLVGNPLETGQTLFDFAGLSFEPSYLEPKGDKRGVLTASQWQVRQPIYQRAVERWRPYRQALQPMIDAMGGDEFVSRYEAELAAR